MLTGLPPFYDQDPRVMYQRILGLPLKFKKSIPADAQPILAGLLERDPARRIGSGPDGSIAVKSHAYFTGIDWSALERREVPPPWKPVIQGPLDVSNFSSKCVHCLSLFLSLSSLSLSLSLSLSPLSLSLSLSLSLLNLYSL